MNFTGITLTLITGNYNNVLSEESFTNCSSAVFVISPKPARRTSRAKRVHSWPESVSSFLSASAVNAVIVTVVVTVMVAVGVGLTVSVRLLVTDTDFKVLSITEVDTMAAEAAQININTTTYNDILDFEKYKLTSFDFDS